MYVPTIIVESMSCGHCEQTVEAALQGVSGVTTATADSETDRASFDGDADVTALVQAVEEAGYTTDAWTRAERSGGTVPRSSGAVTH